MPAARLLARIHLVSIGLYGVQLCLWGHWVMAPAMLVLAISMRFAMRQMVPRDAGAPRRLLLAADGRAHVATVGGAVEPVQLGGESLWLGSALLLVVRSSARTHRLLLGRGNLDPCALATLRRRLRGAAVAPVDPAVDSPPVSGQGSSVVEQLMCGVSSRGP